MKNIFSDLFSGKQKDWPLVFVFGLAVLYGDVLWWQAQQTMLLFEYQGAVISSTFSYLPNARATASIRRQLNDIEALDIGGEFQEIDADLNGL